MMPWRAAAVTGGYLVAWLALDFFGYVIRLAPGVSAWNPADGLSLALVCVFGARMIPLLLVGPLINGWLFWMPDAPLAVAVQAASTTVGYGLAGWMLHVRRTDARLESLNDAAAFLGGAFLGSMLATALSVTAFSALGFMARATLVNAAFAVWAGDMLGILGLGPFLLRAMLWVDMATSGAAAAPDEDQRARVRPWLTAAQAVITLLVVGASPFRWGVFADSPTQLMLICVVWIALTHGAAGAAVAVVGVNLGLLIVKQFADVPLALQDEQLLLGAVGVAGVLAGAAVSEGRRRTAQLAQSRAELERRRAMAEAQKEVETNLARAQEIAGMGSYRWDAATGEAWWSDQFYRLLGLAPGGLVPAKESFNAFVHPDDRADNERLVADVQSGQQSAGLANVLRVIRRDGQVRRFRLAREIDSGPDGRVRRIFGVVQDITEEFETSHALRESRERGAAIYAHMPGAVFQQRLVPDGGIALDFVSRGIERLFGVTAEEALAEPNALFDRIHPDDRLVFRLALQNAAKAGAPWRQEFRIAGPSGTVWIRATTQIRMADDGAYIWDGVLLDINAEKAASEELRKSEERFRRIASDAPMAIAIVDSADGTVRFANASCERMFGYDVGDMRGVGMRALAGDLSDIAKVRAHLRRMGSISNREVRLQRRDGTQFWGIFSFMTVESTDGEEVMVCGFDSTELREARAELSRQAVDLANRINQLHCLYVIARLTNDRQRPVDEICREIVEVMPQGLRAPNQVSVRIALRGEEFKSSSHSDGGTSLVREITVAGEAIGEIEVGVDPTAADPAQMFLRDECELVETAAMHIGRMVSERDLAERLVQAQKLESLGQLTGGIAHDFNNLLTIVFGNLELGEAHCDGNITLQKCFANAMQAARRAADLTAQLQAFSRRQALLPMVVQMNDVVTGMMPLLRRTLGEQIEIVTELAIVPTLTRVDPSQMEASILALAVNARDAMPSGGRLTVATRLVELSADAGKELAAGTYVELSLSDTGTGMAPDVLRRVFEPFFTTKDVGKGSGLGLSMVFGFVKQSGGHVEVTSEPGRGTVFRLYVPILDEREDAAREQAAKRDIASAGECILLVEDEPQVLDFVARLLRTSGYRVLTAQDGAQALEYIRNGSRCHLLLSDVGLPGGMSGVDLARAALGLDPGLKIMLASGYAYEHLQKSGAVGGDFPLVFKPFVRRELLSRIRAILDGEPESAHNRSMGAVA